MFTLARDYAAHGMPAYVALQQAEFADEPIAYIATRHQAEVGTGYFDQVATALNPDSATTALARIDRGGAVHPLTRPTVRAGD